MGKIMADRETGLAENAQTAILIIVESEKDKDS